VEVETFSAAGAVVAEGGAAGAGAAVEGAAAVAVAADAVAAEAGDEQDEDGGGAHATAVP
jgi:hypothetical protein